MPGSSQIVFPCRGGYEIGAQGGVQERPARVLAVIGSGRGWPVLQGILRGAGFGWLADGRPCHGDGGIVGVDQEDAFTHGTMCSQLNKFCGGYLPNRISS